MPSNKVMAVIMFFVTIAIAIYGLITNKKSKEAEAALQNDEEKETEIIPIEARLALRKAAREDDEFWSLDNIDLVFLHAFKDEEGNTVRYSFDLMRNRDSHYYLTPADMEKIIIHFSETTSCEYTVDALRAYLDTEDKDERLTSLFERLGIEAEYEIAPEREEAAEDE